MDQKRFKTKDTDKTCAEVACVKRAGTVFAAGAVAVLAVGAVGIYALIGGSSVPKTLVTAKAAEDTEVSVASESVEDHTETVSQAAVTWKKAGIEEYNLVVETVKATKKTKNAESAKKSETETSAKKKSETSATSAETPTTTVPETTVPQTETEKETSAPKAEPAAEEKKEDEVKDCAAMTMYAAEKVNLRSGPSLDDDVLSVLSQGYELLVTGYTDDWYRVKADGVTGYCMKRYLTEEQPVSEEQDSASSDGVISYTDVEFNMLCYVLQGEVGDCSEASKIAVANVIINRVKSGLFPDSIEGVLTQSGQFDAIWGYYNGSTVPTDNTIQCARRALQGENNVGEAVYYYAPAYCSGDSAAWFESLTFCAEVDGQRFFK